MACGCDNTIYVFTYLGTGPANAGPGKYYHVLSRHSTVTSKCVITYRLPIFFGDRRNEYFVSVQNPDDEARDSSKVRNQ